MNTQQLIISICAVVGALLGVFNLVRSYLADSERVRVAGNLDGKTTPGIHVVNVSGFPISVTAVGYVNPEGHAHEISFTIHNMEKDILPRRVDSRHSTFFEIDRRETIAINLRKPKIFWAKTALGNIFTNEILSHRILRRGLEIIRARTAIF